jgi:phosphatidylserine/phosphatidylglycerophosphate/cardiolipin synthase-like enzyme
MSLISALASIVHRRIGPLRSPIHHRRHHHALRHGRVSPAAREAARQTWWGGDPRWYPAGTPPRRHNRITPLIDGDSFFAALLDAIEAAESYIFIAGWCLTPMIPLRHDDAQALTETRLLAVLQRKAQHVPVRVLLWGGARVLLHPTRADARHVAHRFNDLDVPELVCRLDNSAHFSHCHHQKTIVIDGQVAFVGGMDLTTFQGDRLDLPGHALRAGPNWHDVQLRLEGETVADVEHNFRQRWAGSEGHAYPAGAVSLPPRRAPRVEPGWQTPAQVVRTIARHVYPEVRRGEYGIYHAYLAALSRARRFIYIENQYLWSPQVMDVLIDQIQRPHDSAFRIVIVLPAGAHSGKWDNDQHVDKLREADGGRGIVAVYTLYASGPSAGLYAFRYRPVYLHAKVCVIDDEWLTAGSANLNNRGLITDSELNVVTMDRDLARRVRIDLWAEHLSLPCEQIANSDPISLIDGAWRDRAAENVSIQEHVDRGDRPLVCAIRPYDTGGMPASWLLDEAEALTFEH